MSNRWLNGYLELHNPEKTDMFFPSGFPCTHKGCRNHVLTPCEFCGRFQCWGDVKINHGQIERFKKIDKIIKKINII